MKIEAEVKFTVDGQAKKFTLTQTNEAGTRKDGKPVLLHFQPATKNAIVQPYSKLYIDSIALAGAFKATK